MFISKLSDLYLILTLRCREATELVSQAIDERLPLGKKIALYGHMMICSPCRRFHDQLHVMKSNASFLDGSAQHVGDLLDHKLSTSARQRISDAIQESLNGRDELN